ncbi:unnamed protein product [Rotaria magnacalcarata]
MTTFLLLFGTLDHESLTSVINGNSLLTSCLNLVEPFVFSEVHHDQGGKNSIRAFRMAGNGCEWMGMDANGCEWMRMDGNGCEWMGMAANGWEWMRMDGNGCEWMGMAANGWEWLRMTGNG